MSRENRKRVRPNPDARWREYEALVARIEAVRDRWPLEAATVLRRLAWSALRAMERAPD
jgi:hypothetical protein